jgi:hypothetical protein
LEALQELEVMDVSEAHVSPSSRPAPNWDDETVLELPKTESPSADLLWESRSASITSGGTTRSLTPDVKAPQKRRYVAGVGLALVVSSLLAVGFVSARRHIAAVATSSAQPAPFVPERKPPAGPTAMSAAVEPPLTLPGASTGAATAVSIPIVQLDELPAAASVSRLKSAVSGPHPISIKATRDQRTSVPPIDCDPPYRIDAAGVRRVRLECL